MSTYTVKEWDDILPVMRKIQAEFERIGSIDVITDIHLPEKKPRSSKQNRSLHKYCDIIANKMNAAGFTQRKLVGSFKEGFELIITSEMIKAIFREVAKAMYHKESTAQLTTVEIQAVYLAVDERFGTVAGVRAEWPALNPPTPE